VLSKNANGPGGDRRFIRNAAIVVNLVWTFMAVVFGGFFAGFFLDKWLRTSPAFTLILSALGIAAAVYIVLREAPRLIK
jgi:F0F1-type ATP synthase assembly protein I